MESEGVGKIQPIEKTDWGEYTYWDSYNMLSTSIRLDWNFFWND